VTGVKLDLRFVHDLTTGKSQANALAHGLSGLVNGMHLTGIAEGIETQMQAHTLRAQGWECGQGYSSGGQPRCRSRVSPPRTTSSPERNIRGRPLSSRRWPRIVVLPDAAQPLQLTANLQPPPYRYSDRGRNLIWQADRDIESDSTSVLTRG
jgi:EAL domain-containing protein (putative c-di-GMP-specific phosphodiesterase class I)